MTAFTDEQLRAIERRDGDLLVSAGAGTGKTSVLVERFVRAVMDDGVAVDSILAITFTEKAAAQLAQRVRARFKDLNALDLARAAESAWISTIHGFCGRLLRAHALAAGVDPDFRVLDALESDRLGIDAFDRALAEFVGGGEDPERLGLLAGYRPERLADMVRTAYAHERSRGSLRPRMPDPVEPAAAGEREDLEATIAAALVEIGDGSGSNVDKARDRLARCQALLERLPADAFPEAAETDDLAIAGHVNALKGPACEAYREARQAYHELCVRVEEHRTHRLLAELIVLHGRHYDELKRQRSGLDFDDLQLLARDLLAGDAGLRDHYAGRFEAVMVDEFQDTSPLQSDLIGLLGRDNVFVVGDERQSIYRFRHADVAEFQRRRDEAAAAGRLERISVNFRSRGEVLDAVDLIFGELWGADFEPLRERDDARAAPQPLSTSVELLVTDRKKQRWDDALPPDGLPFGPAMREVTPWRAAEARLLARRIEQLTTEGPFGYGDVAMLLRATTHIVVYERALEERGIPTYVLGGRGYWSQQQVGDLRAYLAALANPRDELALYSALASPLGGLSVDSLIVLKAAAREAGWEIWRLLREVADGGESEAAGTAAEALDRRAADRLGGFVQRFREDRATARRISLEALIDRVITGSGYDRAVLAMVDGDRRMANLRKLMRMAREYEAEEGRDLRGFIDFVAERDMISEREGQAPLEAEDLDAVRLMTIHRSKGLEFPVVCVADLGKGGREDDTQLRITEDGRVGMRLASIAGGSVDSSRMAAIKQEEKHQDEQEERRIFHVALTRAEHHLVLSGATDLEQLPELKDLDEPMRWIWRPLAPDLAEAGASWVSEVAYDGRPLRVRCEVLRPADVEHVLPAADRTPSPPTPELPGLEALAAPALAAVPLPSAQPVSRLSYTGLAGYDRCSYRFYLERALRLPAPEPLAAAAGGETPAGLSALARGSLVHQLLERLDFNGPRPPEREEVLALVQSHGHEPSDDEVADLVGMVARFCESPMCARIAAAGGARAELPFQFTLATGGGRSLLINGVLDVHVREGDRTLVVDYKSDAIGAQGPAALIEQKYATQRIVYALAALRSGAERVEVAYVFLEAPGEPVSQQFSAADAEGLERRLTELAAGIVQGRFEPTDAPHRALCHDCPGRAALCSWSEEHTLADQPVAGAA